MRDMKQPVRGELLSVKHAAAKIGLSPGWIYTGMRTGKIPFPYIQVSIGRVAFDSADIEDYLLRVKHPAGKTQGGSM
jgi:predicted DNA-binding transcriptional regulator AlpA